MNTTPRPLREHTVRITFKDGSHRDVQVQAPSDKQAIYDAHMALTDAERAEVFEEDTVGDAA